MPSTPRANPESTSAAIRAAWTWSVQIATKRLGAESEIGGVANDIVELKRALAGKKVVVHLPEPALCPGGLDRFGGVLRVGVDLGQREVAEHHARAIAQVGPNLPTASWARRV